MALCLISVGANAGESAKSVGSAIELLSSHKGIDCFVASQYFATDPIGGPAGQPKFLNAAAQFETVLSPVEVLRVLQKIENKLGRERTERWGPRTIDLDLLLYDDVVLESAELILPHPRMAFRRFVLEPCADIAADILHPIVGWTIQQLLDHINNAASYVALTGAPGTGKTLLATRVADELSAELITSDVSEEKGELAILESRAKRLARKDGETRVLISDFWLDQSLAYAQDQSGNDRNETEQQCVAIQPDVIQPKLVVMLTSDKGNEIGEFNRRLIQLLTRPGRGPYLLLADDDPDWAFKEVVAAIQAMQ